MIVQVSAAMQNEIQSADHILNHRQIGKPRKAPIKKDEIGKNFIKEI